MFSKFFINRPIFATVISIVIILLGVISIRLLPIEKTPDITPPTVTVSAFYPGANAETLAKTVATPLEEQINGVDNMLYMSSQSTDDGRMELTVTFEIGVDIDMATVLVQNRVAIAESTLPEEVIREGITTKKKSTSFVLIVNMTSPTNKYDTIYINTYINTQIKDVLTRVPGVGDVMIFGEKMGMRIWMDPEQLKARNLTTQDVLNVIREQNIQVAAGQIGTPPVPKGQQFQFTVKTLGRLETVEQFENIIVKTDGSRILRLKDIARIELGSESYSVYSETNGNPSVNVGIFQLPGANALNISRTVHKTMKELSRDFPDGLEFDITYDTTRYIEQSIKEVALTLLITVILVILTVYIFLEDFGATLIPSITIPVSLIGTFAVMYAFGLSINAITLFGLVLVIGIVVDDSIVVVENTMRIIEEEGLSAKQAVTKAMGQITGPIIATTLVLLAVFIPTALVGGVSGKLYAQFAMTISVATVFSTINALTLSPALCGIFLRPIDVEKRGLFFRGFNRFFKKTTNGYMSIINKIVRKSFLPLMIYAVMLILMVVGVKILPTGFLPDEDEGFLFIAVKLPDGASLERTDEVLRKINKILEETDGVKSYITIGGFSLLEYARLANSGTYFVILDDWDQRKSKNLQIEAIMANLQQKLFMIQDGLCFTFRPPAIMGLGFAGGFEMQIQDRAGVGFETLQNACDSLMSIGQNDPVISIRNSSFTAKVPQLYIDIDRTKAKSLGIPLTNIFGTLQAHLGSAYVNDMNLFGRTYKVLIQADREFRNKIEDILKLQVRNDKGEMVPLRTLATVKDSSGPQSVKHFNLYPCSTITGSSRPGYSSGEGMAYMENLCREKLPRGISYQWSGMSYQESQAGAQSNFIFIMGLIFVFLFLAAQYESWSIPFSIILTVPIAVFGALFFTWMRSYDNNTYTQIGLVLLIGLASKTAILLVEFAKQHHEEGHSIIDSATAAARLRFRPILMTASSTVLGILPLVIATGAGAVSRRALGTAVFGGMLIATIAGVFMMPVFYVIIQRITEKTIDLEHKVGDKIMHREHCE